MSVWSIDPAASVSLSGREGALVSVSIAVEPRGLEALLDTLARISFPINPQIYHDAAMVYVLADQRRRTETITLVEFPAYAAQVPEVRDSLEQSGFDPAGMQVTGMLDEIHAGNPPEPAPAGAAWVARYRVKHRTVTATQ